MLDAERVSLRASPRVSPRTSPRVSPDALMRARVVTCQVVLAMRAGSSVTRMGARTGSTTTGAGSGAGAGVTTGPPPHAASMTTGTVPTSTMPVDPARCSDDINDSDDPIDEDTDTNREEMRMPPVCKPGSVGTPKYTGWSFLSTCRRRHVPAAYPRLDARRHPVETGRLSPPIWPCSDRGLPCHVRCRTRGGLLLHPFTLTAFSRRRRFAFCCTVRHSPLTQRAPRRYLAIRPVEPGLSSEHGRSLEGPFPCFATIRPVTSALSI